MRPYSPTPRKSAEVPVAPLAAGMAVLSNIEVPSCPSFLV